VSVEPGDKHGIFIDVEVSDAARSDAELARKLEEACPVDIFAATDGGVEIVPANLDECVLCELCLDAAPAGAVRVVKLYDGGAALERASASV
jgi:NAD-dependent dihydropyrimidine dehydrogenase PreA subunit